MRKLLVTFIAGVMLAGAAATNVSAEEHKVQEGDSLWSIADEYSTTVDDIMNENELDSKMIQPGQKLAIDDKMMYKVKKGDTLSGIAKKFDVKKNNIKDWNELDSDLIVIGQELNLKDVTVDEDDDEESSSDDADASDETEKESDDDKEKSEESKQDTAKPEADEMSTKDEPADESNDDESEEGETINVSSTAYTASCDGCSGVTSTGVDLEDNPDKKVIAVDPDVIPLGSEVYVEGYGHATAADTGGAINGDKIDVHVSDESEAGSWGVQDVDVTILD